MVLLLSLLAPPDSHVETFNVAGYARQALVFPGTGAQATRPRVLVFHGHGGTMGHAARKYEVHRRWPEATVIYPQGLPTPGALTDPEGKRPGWQKRPREQEDRDLAFVDAILSRTPGDSRRTYAMGHSNGGRFTYVLWAARSERFAAYGVSGSSALRLTNALRPASLFATAGERDPLVSYSSQVETVRAVARLDAAELGPIRPDGTVRVAKGRGGLEVGTYFFPGGHEYPSPALDATVRFFQRH